MGVSQPSEYVIYAATNRATPACRFSLLGEVIGWRDVGWWRKIVDNGFVLGRESMSVKRACAGKPRVQWDQVFHNFFGDYWLPRLKNGDLTTYRSFQLNTFITHNRKPSAVLQDIFGKVAADSVKPVPSVIKKARIHVETDWIECWVDRKRVASHFASSVVPIPCQVQGDNSAVISWLMWGPEV